MTFLIQNSQNRDTREIKLQLPEPVRANQRASNYLVSLDALSDAQLDELQEQIVARARHHAERSP